MLRSLIIDDNADFVQAARVLLEREGLTVVGAASTIAAALEQTERLRPDVVLVDIVLGSENGLDLARQLADADGRPVVILCSTHGESDFADLIDEAPVAGFVPKSELSLEAILRLVDRS